MVLPRSVGMTVAMAAALGFGACRGGRRGPRGPRERRPHGVRAPPPQTIQLAGGFGNNGTTRAMAATVNAVKVAAPSAGMA